MFNFRSRNNSISSSNSEDSEDGDMPRFATRDTRKRTFKPENDSEIMKIDHDILDIDPYTLQSLLDIAVNILKQKIDNENQTMTNLISIAVDILKQTVGPPASKSMFYTMPEQDMRYSDLTLKITDTDKGTKQPELVLSTITVKYDDATNKLKITGYDIKNGDGYKEILEELDLGKLEIADLSGPDKADKIEEIITILKEKYGIGGEDENKIKEYLENLGKVIEILNEEVEKIE
jgi:hypothetical protein